MNKSIFIAALSMLCFSFPSAANAQKVGHVNFQSIVQALPDYKTADTEYQVYSQTLEDDLKFIETEYTSSLEKLNEEQSKPQPNATKVKIHTATVQKLQMDYQETQQVNQEKLREKLAELTQPLTEKVSNAVSEVAKEKGYSHVIDNSYGTLIYADDAHSLDKAVKAKLKIVDTPVVNPGAGKGGAASPGASK
jgi:outer membrane protein